MPIVITDQAIFEVARRIDSGEARDAYLLQMCSEDPAMEQRVRDLLKAYDESASFAGPSVASGIARAVIRMGTFSIATSPLQSMKSRRRKSSGLM